MNDAEFSAKYGPWALVTGASSGIGRAFAELLGAKKINLVLTARRAGELEQLASRLAAAHAIQTKVCVADLADAAAPAQLLAATADLDIGLLVSNAGFGMKGPHAGNDPQAMADMVMVNCTAPMLLTHGFIPRLGARGKGGMILVSSVEGLFPCPNSLGYSSTKAFAAFLGEGLWAELKGAGIDVLTLLPGATNTEAPIKQGYDVSKLTNVMQPEEVARLALDNIENGPTLVSSAHYKAIFDKLLSMPRADALKAMASQAH
jgi:short-subunit dehydrogenase